MSNDTVTYDGIEFDIEDLEDALDIIQDGDADRASTGGRVAMVGDVVVAGDGDADDFLRVACREDVTIAGEDNFASGGNYSYTRAHRLRSAISEARTVSFEEYIEENLDLHENTSVNTDAPTKADAELTDTSGDTGLFIYRECRSIDDDDGVRLRFVEHGNLYLEDVRDE